MFVHPFYLLLCLGLMHVSAYPALEDSTDDSPITDPTSVDDEPNDTKQESDVVVLGIEESGSEDEASEPNEPQESSTDEPEESGNEILKVDESLPEDKESNSGDNTEEVDETPESSSSEPVDTTEESNSEVSSKESSPDDKQSSSDDDTSDSEDSKSDDFDDSIPSIVLSDIFLGKRQLKVIAQDNGYEKLICQILLDNEKFVDKECLTVRPFLVFGRKQEFVNLNQKLIDGEKYFCQEIINQWHGVLQQLCVSHDGWIFNPVLQIHDSILF